MNKTTDHICELHRRLEQVTARQISARQHTELCLHHNPLESDVFSTDEFQRAVAEMQRQVYEELERSLAGKNFHSNNYQISSTDSFRCYRSGTVTVSDIESIFDDQPESDADLDTHALSSFSEHEESDRLFDLGSDSCEDWPPRDAQATKLDNPPCGIDWCSELRDPDSNSEDIEWLEQLMLSKRALQNDVKPTELDTVSCAATEIDSTLDSYNFEHLIAES
jgi:hypothetical protein